MSSKDLTEALHKLTLSQRGESEGPPAMAARGIAPAVKSAALLAGSASSSGIASPLTETAYSDRTYHSTKTITSTDGLLTFEVDPIKQVFFQDAAGKSVEIYFQSP